MYRWKKDIVEWTMGKTLYLSVVFSWDLRKAKARAKQHKGKVIVGGPAAVMNSEIFEGIAEVRTEMKGVEPILFHNPLASFSSKGCIRNCKFCVVRGVEGDLKELKNFRPAPVMCDNNFLACSAKHQERVIETLKDYPLVDFNQGLDARLFDKNSADRLSKLKLRARFAFDSIKTESKVVDAIKLCQKRTTKDIRCYVLIGYKDTPEDALYRLELLKSMNVLTNPLRYQPSDAKKRNDYLAPEWTVEKMEKMRRYYSLTNYLGHIPFEDYKRRKFRRGIGFGLIE